jgi:hypothetical protein
MDFANRDDIIDRFEARLTELALLLPGWLDGEGSTPTPAAIAYIEAWIGAVADELPADGVFPSPHLFPSPEGGFTIETLKGEHGYWGVDVQETGLGELWILGDGLGETHGVVTAALAAARSYVDWAGRSAPSR